MWCTPKAGEAVGGPTTEVQALLNSKGRPPREEYEIKELAFQSGKSEEEMKAAIAAGKIINHLMNTDDNECGINESIYDAALVLPQVARSALWPRSLTNLCVRTYFFLFINFFFQMFILYMIATEEEIMDKFSGQMSLCDFGANVQDCPGGPNCIGPAGSNFENAGRMYGYTMWASRTYTRDSLLALFPDKADQINQMIDPGEYGVENYWIRFVCVFIFMMSVMADLRNTMDISYILYYVPTKEDVWMSYDVPDWASKEEVKQVKDCEEMDFVKFRIAGMPLVWKIINFLLIVVPKLFIWKKTAKYGVMFLMETSGIEDVIVNVTALAFILNLDEMLYQAFSHKAVHYILQGMQPYEVENQDKKENYTLQDTLATLHSDRFTASFILGIVPVRFLMTLVACVFFAGEYYWTKCQFSERGGFVSKTEYLPKQQVLSLARFFLPWVEIEEQETPFFEMPR